MARKNLKAFKDAKEYVLKEYADLFDGIDIELTQINEKNIGEACWVESCIKVNFEKVVSGERRYMTSDFVETLVHEALHVRVIEEIGLFSYFLNHERAHHWIGRSGQGAGAYHRGPNIFERPDISMNKFNSYMNGD
ncbi:hypothetical protein J8M20_24670 [Pseudoalteromonas luteoviolacea]|uniref:hypothetical protein n=1 Tax=Pseudoalteromonas luteoviolacea TaxID=43657 RepID=UPI001B3688DB|nr:hypothetical protein [Pseudoalteromonas luteoviolacea]MBQ4814581.1 hypothetical protein [Pseudoalteromonas luteoviolacea]